MNSAKDDKALLRGWQNYHMNSKKWVDLGYNEAVTREGYVCEGRAGGLNANGAHAGKANSKWLGFCFQGTYQSEAPTREQWNAAVERLAFLCVKLGISPFNIKGHRDFMSRDCPGNALYAALPQLRSDVHNSIKGKEQKPEPPKPDPKSEPKPPGPRNLKRGMHGEDVKQLQLRINHLGFSPGPFDGIFGNKTDRAVRAFQNKARLSVDGVVGPKTRAAMANWVAPKPVPPQPQQKPQVKHGSRGQAVREAQTLLRTKGYPLAVDGKFGPRTERATIRFQSANGLAADGIIGPKTWAKLLA